MSDSEREPVVRSASRDSSVSMKRQQSPVKRENNTIRMIKNMSFLGKRDTNISTRRCVSEYSLAQRHGALSVDKTTKIVVGRGLTTRHIVLPEVDEIDAEVHRVENAQYDQSSFHQIIRKESSDGAECIRGGGETGALESTSDLIVCEMRKASSTFVGTDSIFPLSTVPVPPGLQFKLDFTGFNHLEHLTDGSNSEIYKACHRGILCGRDGGAAPTNIIIKLVKADAADFGTAVREFDFERDILAAISHPNIISLLGSGVHDCHPFLVVERLDGGSLTYHLTRPRNTYSKDFPFSVLTALGMARDLSNAVKYLHDEFHPHAVLLHRDIKPDNICFTKDMTLKLMDFGISTCIRRRVLERGPYKMTGMSGSLRYMAPEVALFEPYNELVDVYSFGILFWQILTGLVPFHKFKKNKFMLDVVQNRHRPDVRMITQLAEDNRCAPSTAEELSILIARCWSHEFADRPRMKEVHEKLFELYGNERERVKSKGCCR